MAIKFNIVPSYLNFNISKETYTMCSSIHLNNISTKSCKINSNKFRLNLSQHKFAPDLEEDI
jgi:hypothetical protein